MIDHSKCKWICNTYHLSPVLQSSQEDKVLHDEWVNEMLHDKAMAGVFRQKVKELGEEIKECVRQKDFYCKAVLRSKGKRWNIYPQMWLEYYRKKHSEHEKSRDRFYFYYKVSLGKSEMNRDSLIELKKVPIGNFINGPPGQSGSRQSFKCPFHQEKTPSFVWYTKNNTYYCFGGCGAGGDVIDFYMRKFNVSFKEAIKELSNFI